MALLPEEGAEGAAGFYVKHKLLASKKKNNRSKMRLLVEEAIQNEDAIGRNLSFTVAH